MNADARGLPEYRIHLACEAEVPRGLLEEVEQAFHETPGPMKVVPLLTNKRLPRLKTGVIPWEGAFLCLDELRREKQIPKSEPLTLLTTAPNEQNWFTVPDPSNPANTFGQVEDFSWATTAPSWAIVSHYLVKDLLVQLLLDAGCDIDTASGHSPSRGCVSDFCADKTDLGLKLRTADICGECMFLFQEVGISEDLIRQIVLLHEKIRRTALSTGPYLKVDHAFTEWPFPVAITRHKVAQATNPALRLIHLLDHFDSLVRYSLLTHELTHGRAIHIPERPSLGWWVTNLETAFRDAPQLHEVVRIAESHQIVSLRNEIRGHGWLAADAEAYRGDCASLQAALLQIERVLAPLLHDFVLTVPKDTILTMGRYHIRGDLLSGSHFLHPPLESITDLDPRDLGIMNAQSVHLARHDFSKFWDCSPHMLINICPECRNPRLLITDGGTCYIDAQVGHRVNGPFH